MPSDEPRCARGGRTSTGARPRCCGSTPCRFPSPKPGELRVRVQAIPFNLNDLERITGGNMMVRPELPYSPGMEVMGVVDACGAGTEEWQGRRVVAMPKGANGGFAEYAICPVVSAFEMPESIPLPGAAALYFPFHLAWLGLFDRAELQAGESVLIHAAAGRFGIGRDPARQARRRARVRDRGHRREGAALPRPRRRRRDQLQRRPTSRRSCSPRPATAASTSCSTTSAKP